MVRCREPGAAHSDHVEAGDAVLSLLEDERRDVLGCRTHAAEHCQPADPHALLNRSVAGKNAAVVEDDVPGDQCVVDDGAVVADLHVVAEMAADHEHVAVTDRW